MLRIEMLPARHGDALWISWGAKESSLRHMVVDTGFRQSARVIRKRLHDDPRLALELLVLTHIDADHIEGAVTLLADAQVATPARIKEVWFNGWRHIADLRDDALGSRQGEYVSAEIRARKLPWNASFRGKAVVVPSRGTLPSKTLPGGMKLTLLSPTAAQLVALRRHWVSDLEGKLAPGDEKAALRLLAKEKKYAPDALGSASVAKLAKAPFVEDDKAANGSSIALLAEHEGRTLLLAGDAFPSVLAASIDRLPGRDALELDVLKLSHHGSSGNTSPALIDRIWYDHVLVSTNGDQFGHPSPETIARLIAASPDTTLCFNYRSDCNAQWLSPATQRKHGYRTIVGDDGHLVLEL